MKSSLLLGVAAIAVIAAAPTHAEKGGRHVKTEVEHRTLERDRNATRTRTVRERVPVEDTTIVKDVTRVHPVVHETDIERILHHLKHENKNETVVRPHTEAARVIHEPVTEHVGTVPKPREHVVTRYHDVNEPEYRTRVHNVEGSPVIDLTVHRKVLDEEIEPVIHERDIRRVVEVPVYRHRTEHEPVRETETARTVVTHKREDVDP